MSRKVEVSFLNISIEDGAVFLTHENTIRYIKPDDFISILSDVLDKRAYSPGLLPPGTRQVCISSDSAVYVIELPQSVQPLTVAVSKHTRFTVPLVLPPMLFVVSMKNTRSKGVSFSGLRAFAFQYPLTLDSMLYIPPLPNVFIDSPVCRVCTGDISPSPAGDYNAVAIYVVSHFFSSTFNTDLSTHLSDYLYKLVLLFADDQGVALLNSDTPIGSRLFEAYSQQGSGGLWRCLFSTDLVRLFCQHYACDTDPDRFLSSVTWPSFSYSSDTDVRTLFSSYVQSLSQASRLLFTYLVMSALTTYPLSVLSSVGTYGSIVTELLGE